jgi:hypothetical protein
MRYESLSTALLVGAAWVCVLGTDSARATVLEGPVFNPTTRNAYYLLESAAWTVSEAQAVGLGGHLVTVNNDAENSWIIQTFANLSDPTRTRVLWIGLNDVSIEGDFRWASGEGTNFRNWNVNEPNNTFGVEHFVHIITKPYEYLQVGKWNDLPNDPAITFPTRVDLSPTHGVAEVMPLPGDADMNRAVNFADLLVLAQNYNRTYGATWLNGDFDWNGAVNFADLLILAQAYNTPSFESDWTHAQSVVPEPTVIGAALVMVGLLGRRYR